MKVLLIKKIDKLGDKGAQVEVSNGYAKNYLIPFSKAVLATTKNINNSFKIIDQKYSLKDYNVLNNTTIIIPVKVKKNDDIYGVINLLKLSVIIKKLKLKLNIKDLSASIFLRKIGN